jgi:cation-transporting ATPase 13A1
LPFKDPPLPKKKLLLDCILIVTSVVPPELPMELSMAVNASLVTLGRLAVFCTEPFRIPDAGRVDVVCWDKTGTITGKDMSAEGVVGISRDPEELVQLGELLATNNTALAVAAAHALVRVTDGKLFTIVFSNRLLNFIR